MTTNASDKASSSPNPATVKSLFSRLTSPLRQRTRNLADFHIKPFDPHRRYSPGDPVKGLVVFTVVKPIRVTHITVALHGFVHVYKSPNNTSELASHDSQYMQTGNAKKSQYFGNGHASLFQDEIILCGEGRLEVGVYEFEFDLEFPRRQLPSSIDFERGTISYQIRSTITRPTSIAAVTACDRKVNLIETIDVGLLAAPKPRTISLEPILKRSRRTKTAKLKDAEATGDAISVSDATPRPESPISEESASQDGSTDRQTGPRSPMNSDELSERSADSVVSSSTGMSFRLGAAPSSRSGRASRQSNSSSSEKTIYATIELLKAGCLPGDNIPLKVSIQHTKRIKSMHGIIITLYRQGRIDSAPPLEMFKDLTGKAADKMKHEEYYPKSKTGLGGLSLSSAGTSSVFRKDLSQSFAPIITDPKTLSTVVTASVRVPEDVFPTITGTPGQMISFKYYIEVVVDLGGKLAGQDRHVPRLGMINVPSNFMTQTGNQEASANTLAAWGGSIVETDQFRREKSVVACLFEVIVGTMDSQRQSRRRGNTVQSNPQEQSVTTPRSQTFSHVPEIYEEDGSQHQGGHGPEPDYYPSEGQHRNGDARQNGIQSHGGPDHHARSIHSRYDEEPPYAAEPEPYGTPQISVPPPEAPFEDALTEKDRIRRAEQQLLPSQPPEDEAGPSSARPHQLTPSAPAYFDDHNGIPNYMQATTRGSSPGPSIPMVLYEAGPSSHFDEEASAPPIDDLTPHASASNAYCSFSRSSSSRTPIADDKQELERRRLLAEASSPNDFPDEETADGGVASGTPLAPSAPMLSDEDEYDYGHVGGSGTTSQQASSSRGATEHLPRYER